MQRHVVLFLCFGLVAMFVAGLLAIATPSDALDARIALESPLSRWKQLGGSDDLGSLAPPRLPAAMNAAPRYRRAFAELRRLDETDRRLLDVHTLRTRPHDVAVIASRLDWAVEHARKAARYSGCQWNRGFYGSGALGASALEEFDLFVKLAVAVAAHAIDRANTGDLEAAVTDLAAMRRMGGHAVAHPHVAQAAMGLFIDIAALDVLERVFRDQELPEPVAKELAASRDHRTALRDTFLTHGAAGLLQLDDPTFASPVARAGPERDRAKAWFLHSMCDYLAVLDQPGTRVVLMNTPPGAVTYARVLVPSPTVLDAIHMAATRNDMAVAALKLRSHRAVNGNYPDSWEIPTNPDTGVVLHYRRAGDGFVLSTDNDQQLDWRWN